MKIKKLHIQNFKSLVDFQLEDMPQFCAFVGPNASGKSNIFEAIEFINYFIKYKADAINLFGDIGSIVSFNAKPFEEVPKKYNFSSDMDIIQQDFQIYFNDKINFPLRIGYDTNKMLGFGTKVLTPNKENEKPHLIFEISQPEQRAAFVKRWNEIGNNYESDFEIFIDNFSRVFVGKPDLIKINQSKLLIDGSNTAQILGQVFQDDLKREDFIEWLRILIPEFENIEVKKNEFDGSFHIFVKEKTQNKHFSVKLLSDGTKNILALMAAVYQSNQPQFLCIEEPENGLHPHAIELLVDFFREKCETEGHHIWLNTHSPTLVRCLAIDEVITVNKINGETKARQFKKEEAFNMKMDEAWLTNALGGGVPW